MNDFPLDAYETLCDWTLYNKSFSLNLLLLPLDKQYC